MKNSPVLFVILAGSAVLTIFAAEVVARWNQARVRPIETRSCRRESPIYHHELIPNTTCRSRYPEWDSQFRVNNLGFRGADIAPHKPPDVFRVAVMGDSFVESESMNAEETAVYLVEKMIREEMHDPKIEVLNVGVMSYAPIIYKRVIEDKVLPLSPDLVIVNIDMSDFQNDYTYSLDLGEDGRFRNILFQQQMGAPHVALPGISSKMKFFLRTHSALYSLVADRTKQLARRIWRIPEPTVFQVNDPKSDPHYATRSDEHAGDELMWSEFSKSMTETSDLLRVSRTPWVATIYPYGHQAAPDGWKKGRLMNGFESNRLYSAKVADLLTEKASVYHVPIINLVPQFRDAAARWNEPLYFESDGHFSVKGQQVFAQALLPIVRDHYTHNRQE